MDGLSVDGRSPRRIKKKTRFADDTHSMYNAGIRSAEM
jgi:hypothetical protein